MEEPELGPEHFQRLIPVNDSSKSSRVQFELNTEHDEVILLGDSAA